MNAIHRPALISCISALMALFAAGCSEMESSAEGGLADGSSSAEPDTSVDPGQGSSLTAGVWDDNRNYSYFMSYLEEKALLSGISTLTSQERELARDQFAGDRPAKAELDVAFVFDTTGSMGDELSYLQSELSRIAAGMDALLGSGSLRFALIVYRNNGDAYVTRSFDFASLEVFQTLLSAQSAYGGGDYPEATEEALEDVLQLSWRNEADVARMTFWLTDAPHHPEQTARIDNAVRAAAVAGIHYYPVAASGTDELAEYTMRSTAQVTGGRYLFLTDDSGIGNAHTEPTLPCYFVTSLQNAMVRMAKVELSGVYAEPEEDEVIRTGGDPENGACMLDNGTEVFIF